MEKDDFRLWVDIGGDLEASYDGLKYVDFRSKSTGVCTMFAGRELLERALTLFPAKMLEVR